jgi:hypothetical protein
LLQGLFHLKHELPIWIAAVGLFHALKFSLGVSGCDRLVTNRADRIEREIGVLSFDETDELDHRTRSGKLATIRLKVGKFVFVVALPGIYSGFEDANGLNRSLSLLFLAPGLPSSPPEPY